MALLVALPLRGPLSVAYELSEAVVVLFIVRLVLVVDGVYFTRDTAVVPGAS